MTSLGPMGTSTPESRREVGLPEPPPARIKVAALERAASDDDVPPLFRPPLLVRLIFLCPILAIAAVIIGMAGAASTRVYTDEQRDQRMMTEYVRAIEMRAEAVQQIDKERIDELATEIRALGVTIRRLEHQRRRPLTAAPGRRNLKTREE